MSDPFLAEIRIFAGNFAPREWAFCDGQILPISQNTALFSLMGTTYGGNGFSNFALPDLRGRAPMHPGIGPGLSARTLGESGGSETVALQEYEMPPHTHAFTLPAATSAATSNTPVGNVPAIPTENAFSQQGTPVELSAASLGVVGSGSAHNNMQPYLTLSFIIALQGVFPSRW